MDASTKIALVTGGNRGLGFETCRQLGRLNFKVILGARDKNKGEAAAAKLRQEKLDVSWQALDVTNPESISSLRQFVADKFGRLDVLINNAAILLGEDTNVLELSVDELRHSMDSNVYGPLLLCQAFVPLMQKNGYGRVVNVSSVAGQLASMTSYAPAYSMSKTCLNALTRLVSAQTRTHNILVNAVCPGWVKTDMGGSAAPLSPVEGADTIVWLAMLPDGGPNGEFFQNRRVVRW